MPENVGFISTRFAGTDGVSLEAAKWAEVLWDDGHISFWYAGRLDRDPATSFCVPEAHFGHPENEWINRHLWGYERRTPLVSRRVRDLAEYLKSTLYEYVHHYDLTLLIVQNALAIPMHVPLGLAITEFLEETGTPAIAHHHDFYWERMRFQLGSMRDYLDVAFPPRPPTMQHVVINQAAKEELAWRRGTGSVLVPNVLDFHSPPEPSDAYASDIPSELGLKPGDRLILQPTRVVPRKGIEHAIGLLRALNDPHNKLVISHLSGDEGYEYVDRIQELAADENIELILFGDRISDQRQLDDDGRKMYTLDDLYPFADLVTFPSLYEGFGNALLEAIYYRRPVMVNRYPVYARDIEPKGLRMAVMDGMIDRDVIDDVRRLLDHPDHAREATEYNYRIARDYYSYPVLRYSLQTLISNIHNLTL